MASASRDWFPAISVAFSINKFNLSFVAIVVPIRSAVTNLVTLSDVAPALWSS